MPREPYPEEINGWGNEKWKSEERMPWPREYFRPEPANQTRCPLSNDKPCILRLRGDHHGAQD